MKGKSMSEDRRIDTITETAIRQSLENINAALEMRFGGAAEETAWLIEYPPSQDAQPRWWHPVIGWTIDPNRALRLSRKEDAEAVIAGSRALPGVATEHRWISRQALKDTQ